MLSKFAKIIEVMRHVHNPKFDPKRVVASHFGAETENDRGKSCECRNARLQSEKRRLREGIGEDD
jgi:hypothetical protein